MNLYQYFAHNGTLHSRTAAYLLALPSYFSYETSITWTSNFVAGFEKLMKALSGNDSDALRTRFFYDLLAWRSIHRKSGILSSAMIRKPPSCTTTAS